MAEVGIAPERGADRSMIRALHAEAFETAAEAELVDRLREQAQPLVSLVARLGDVVVGHILFSPARMAEQGRAGLLALAPMAVLPAFQRQGIGGRLVEAGLDAANEIGARAVIVLGHPGYYPKFGFVPASRFGLSSGYRAPDEAFMAMEIVPDALAGLSGRVEFHPAFSELVSSVS